MHLKQLIAPEAAGVAADLENHFSFHVERKKKKRKQRVAGSFSLAVIV